jgi:FG-GAP-like repeat
MALATPYDYNGDGFSDVRWFNNGTNEELIWNIQNNQFNSQQVVNRSVFLEGGFLQPFSPQAGDFNGDGTSRTSLFGKAWTRKVGCIRTIRSLLSFPGQTR